MKILNVMKFSALSAVLLSAGHATQELSRWGAHLGPTFQAGIIQNQTDINRRAIGGRFISDFFEYPLAFQSGVTALNNIIQRFNSHYVLRNGNITTTAKAAAAELPGSLETIINEISFAEGVSQLFDDMHRFLDPTIDDASRQTLYAKIYRASFNPADGVDGEERPIVILGDFQSLLNDMNPALTTLREATIAEIEAPDLTPDDIAVLEHDLDNVRTAADSVAEILVRAIDGLDRLSATLEETTSTPLFTIGDGDQAVGYKSTLTDQSIVDILNRNDITQENLIRIILAKVSDLHRFL
ncbi:MAG: hypothetical protein LBF66_02070 [Holosporales bacterium]|jgi:hypothetical protein|nr:hypothetical protein [Holosporales bacterium]